MAFMLPPFSQQSSLTGLSTTQTVLNIYTKNIHLPVQYFKVGFIFRASQSKGKVFHHDLYIVC